MQPAIPNANTNLAAEDLTLGNGCRERISVSVSATRRMPLGIAGPSPLLAREISPRPRGEPPIRNLHESDPSSGWLASMTTFTVSRRATAQICAASLDEGQSPCQDPQGFERLITSAAQRILRWAMGVVGPDGV